MKKLKKNMLLLTTALLIVSFAIIWIATAPNRNKTKAFLARYEITDLTALDLRYVTAINDKGQALGRDKQNDFKVLNIPQETECSALAFNNSG